MKVYCINGYKFDSNVYIINGNIPTIIDCGTGLYNKELIKKIKKIIDIKKIKQMIITHEHYDHCGGVKNLYETIETKPKILSHIKAAQKIKNGESMFAKMLGGEMPKMKVDIKLKDNDQVKIGDNIFHVLYTPGHSVGSICLYDKITKSLLSGDTIFSYGSFGRYDFPGGNLNLLRKSIERLSFLDIDNLYPGHELYIEENGNKHVKMSLENIKTLF